MGLFSDRLVLRDSIVITYPTEEPLLDGKVRKPLGRTKDAEISLHGQYEPTSEGRRNQGNTGADVSDQGVLILDYAECVRLGYTPSAKGHRLTSVTHHETRITTAYNLYLNEPTVDGAGGLYRCALSDRAPEKKR